MRKIPIKNYFILLILIIATVGIVLFGCDVYESRIKKQYTSIMNSFITEIKLDDLNGYTLENSPVVIYISDKSDVTLEELEKKYKEILTEYNIQKFFVYLDVSNKSVDIFRNFEEKYKVDLNDEILPNLVVIDEGKVVDYYSSSDFNELNLTEFLRRNEVIESD